MRKGAKGKAIIIHSFLFANVFPLQGEKQASPDGSNKRDRRNEKHCLMSFLIHLK
jgi:hypothetical protein